MAFLNMELRETYASITRPVAYDITKQLLKKMAVEENIKIYFPGANGKSQTWNSGEVQSQDNANFNTKQHIRINVKEDYVEEELLTMYSSQRNNPYIFRDPLTNITMHPIYSRTKVVLSVSYRTRDRYEAESFRDNWRRKIAENREYMTFTAKYTYPIPETTEQALYILYLLRNNRKKECKSYTEYVFKYGTPALTSLTNVAGNGDTLAVEETQLMIHGILTDNSPPEAEKDDKGSVWVVNFDMEYFYDKVISINLTYPLLVQNQLVPEPLQPELLFDVNELNAKLSQSRNWFNYIQSSMGYMQYIRGAYVRIPKFDDWSHQIRFKNYRPLLTAMLTVDENNPREIFNLKDMGEYQLLPAVQESFSKTSLWLTLPYESPFIIQLYKNDNPLPHDYIHVDKDLNIVSTYDLDPNEMYHIVISILNDIHLLSKEAEKRFFSNHPLVYTWLDIRLGHAPDQGYPKVNKNGWVDFNEFIEITKRHNLASEENYAYHYPGKVMSTLAFFGVVTHRQEDREPIIKEG